MKLINSHSDILPFTEHFLACHIGGANGQVFHLGVGDLQVSLVKVSLQSALVVLVVTLDQLINSFLDILCLLGGIKRVGYGF